MEISGIVNMLTEVTILQRSKKAHSMGFFDVQI